MAGKILQIGKATRGGALALCVCAGFAGASAQGPALAMLDRLEPGLWDVSPHGTARNSAQLCIDNGRKLIQLRHAQETCKRFIVEDTAGTVTVHYTCPAGGYGHTKIRFENARLAQVETQGIDDGLPFNFAAEARRIGVCTREMQR